MAYNLIAIPDLLRPQTLEVDLILTISPIPKSPEGILE